MVPSKSPLKHHTGRCSGLLMTNPKKQPLTRWSLWFPATFCLLGKKEHNSPRIYQGLEALGLPEDVLAPDDNGCAQV